MFRHLILLTVVLGIGETAGAQVVMLPTQQQFRYRGSVLVPDGGSAYLGGNSRYATGSSRRGIAPFSSSRGSSIGAGGLSISATIIDHQEMDRQLLGGTPQEFMDRVRRERVVEPPAVASARVPTSTTTASRTAPASNTSSVEEGKALVRYARRLYSAGEIERSKAAYRLAFPLLNENLRTLAAAEYNRVATLPR